MDQTGRIWSALSGLVFLLAIAGCTGGASDSEGELTTSEKPTTAAISFVQVNASTPQSPASVVTTAYSKTQIAGDLNIVVVGWNDTVASVTAVKDTRGNAYTRAVGPTSGTGLRQSIYYAKNIASGANAVTVMFDRPAVYVDVRALEYGGLDRLSPLDATAVASGRSASASSGAATTTAANELVFGAGMTSGAFTAAGTGFTARILTSPDADIAEDRIVSSAGSYSAAAPEELASSNWVMQMVTFRAASSALQYPLLVSSSVTHSAPSLLAGATLSGGVYIFTGDASYSASPTGIAQVRYYLDDPSMSGSPTHVENYVPYDFTGGVPWDTSTVAGGTHSITESVTLISSAIQHATASFTIASGGGTSSGTCSPSFGSFGPNNWPPACWRPYADSSPFNRPVPASPKLSTSSAGIVSRLVSNAPGGHIESIFQAAYGVTPTGNDCNHPVFFSSPSDPLYTVQSTTCSQSQLWGKQLRIPTVARPSGQGSCSDHHIAIVDQSTSTEWDFYQFPIDGVSGGGTLPHVSSCGALDVQTGSGFDSHVTASYFAEWAGMIRGPELKGGQINHALFITVTCDNGTKVYPADQDVSWVNSYPCSSTSNAAPVGARFWLDYTDAQIAALSIPAWEKTIVTALAHYGGYVGDQQGPNTFSWGTLSFESGETYSVYGAPQPIQQVAQAAGIPFNSGIGGYIFTLAGVDWANHLHVLDPCTAQGTCP